MKKAFYILTIITLVLALLTSCANTATTSPPINITPKTYTVLETSLSSDSSAAGVKHKSEIDLEVLTLQEEAKKDSTAQVTINGTNFTGVYKDTIVRKYYNFDYEEYTAKSGSTTAIFKINPANNELVGFQTRDAEYLQKNANAKELSQEECTDIAWNYLKGHVSDIENYRIISVNFNESEAHKGLYWFRFYRYIGETQALDCAFIYVTVYGDVVRFSKHNLGGFEGTNILSKHSEESIDSAINAKLSEIYGALENNPDYTIQYAKSRMLVRLADGKYALEYTITAYITGGGKEWSDDTSLIIYLD